MTQLTKPEKHAFIAYLESLRDREDQGRGVLAILRRGLGKAPGEEIDMMRYIVPWVPADASHRVEESYYLIASLFALHPAAGGSGNMGDHLARVRDADSDAVERRFIALLSAHPHDLPYQLRQAVSFLRSKEIPVNWDQLLRDLWNWEHPDRYVQRAWANAFWGRGTAIEGPESPKPSDQVPETQDQDSNEE